MSRTKTTFVGPVTSERTIANGARVLSIYFLLMSSGSDPLKLEYPSKRAAVAARKQVLKSPEAFGVPSTRLLKAIHEAIQQASSQEPDEPKDRLS